MFHVSLKLSIFGDQWNLDERIWVSKKLMRFEMVAVNFDSSKRH